MQYAYGMRLRGYSPMCQPKEGLLEVLEDTSGSFYNVLVYGRKLTDREVENYELQYLGVVGVENTKCSGC